jgi:uncharacterized membrane protein (DUF2068 family)
MSKRRDRGLLLIGVFKLVKSALLIAVGVVVLLQLKSNSVRTLVDWALHLRIDPDNALIHAALERLFRLDRKKLEALGIGTFIYAAVFATEGIGLLLAKRWAEYVTLGVTISFIPIECFELAKQPSAMKAATIAINVAVVIYLALRLLQKKHRKRK